MQGSLVTKSDSFRARRLTRRELIILLTAGAGFFSVAKASAGLLKAQFPKGCGKARKLSQGRHHSDSFEGHVACGAGLGADSLSRTSVPEPEGPRRALY